MPWVAPCRVHCRPPAVIYSSRLLIVGAITCSSSSTRASRLAFANVSSSLLPSLSLSASSCLYVKSCIADSDQLENHLEKVRRRHEESRDPIVSQLQSLLDGMREQERQREPLYQQMSGLGGQLASTLEGLSGSLEAAVERRLQGLEERLPGQLRTMVREEVGQALRQQQTSLNDQLTALFRSATPTTPSTPDPQQMRSNVAQLLREGEVNAAFQQALSASDLNLVIFVCEMVNPTQLFEQDPCPLQQPVLLSLIQQLSADFHSNLPLKLT